MTERLNTTEHPVIVLHRLRQEASEGRQLSAAAKDENERRQYASEAADAESKATKLEQQLREAGHRL